MPLQDNPVLLREMRRRFRGPAFVLGWVLGYALFLAMIVLVAAIAMFYFKKFTGGSSTGQSPFAENQIGLYLNHVLLFFQRWFFFFIIPGIAASSITLEKEKKTLHMAVITSMSSTDIMMGKLIGIFLFIGVLIITSIPIAMMTLQFGGLSWWDLLKGYILLFLAALYYVGCGIGASGLCEKTITATMITYGMIAVMYFATSIIPVFLGFAFTMAQNQSLQKWIQIYPWIILIIKVSTGLALLWFGWYRVKNFELAG